MSEGKVLLLLCRTLGSTGQGLNLSKIAASLEESYPALRVEGVDGLCETPDGAQVALKAAGPSCRLIVGGCGRPGLQPALQRQARKAGLDPFAVRTVDLLHLCALAHPGPAATEKAKLLLAAAIERELSYTGPVPENLQARPLSLDWELNRRDLLGLPLQRYSIVPRVNPASCLAGLGCDMCLQACPHNALQREEEGVRVDKGQCLACGLCMGRCPAGAIEFPTWSTAELAAEVRALLTFPRADVGPRVIAFTCQKAEGLFYSAGEGGATYPSNVLSVMLPCLGMATPLLLLSCVYLGAAAIGLVLCGQGCTQMGSQLQEQQVSFVRNLLLRLGLPPDMLQEVKATVPAQQQAELEALASFSKASSRRPSLDSRALSPLPTLAALALELVASHRVGDDLVMADKGSPLGVVDIDPEVCTVCGLCALRCPTGALALSEREEIVLTFDATLCTGCGLCLSTCPERSRGAIVLRREVNLRALRQGRWACVVDPAARCADCGKPFLPRRMLQRVQSQMEGKGGPFPQGLLQRCPDCRLAAQLSRSKSVS